MNSRLENKYLGTLLGLACGDAVGTTVEFSPRDSFPPMTDMVGGGPFGLKPGQWTDDTSMALCLAESLVERNGFDPADQMMRYLNWWRWGYLSSTGTCFDIGNTVSTALAIYEKSGEYYAGSPDPSQAGNGSLMRLGPVVLYGYKQPDLIPLLAANSSRTTHGAAEAIESCQLLALLLYGALCGIPKAKLLPITSQAWHQEKVARLAQGEFIHKPRSALVGSGYCVQSLEAALWCFFNTDTYRDAVLAAVNLGDDADTTGAIAGQLAGAYYGVESIPERWLELLTQRHEIEGIARKLFVQFAA